ncbi:MAG: hypothetical protein LBC43_01270 [Bifidobacteriaceae bacterium]|nr:hypothetical protein [Bifidobacteriaceae bacterium]
MAITFFSNYTTLIFEQSWRASHRALVVVPVVFVLATLSYYFIEQLFRKASKPLLVVAPLLVGFLSLLLMINLGINSATYAQFENAQQSNDVVNELTNQDSAGSVEPINVVIERYVMEAEQYVENYVINNEIRDFDSKYCVGAIGLKFIDECPEPYGKFDRWTYSLSPYTGLAWSSLCFFITTFDDESLSKCTFGDLSSSKTILLVGDSHAAHWLEAFDSAGRILGYKVILAAMEVCTPFLINREIQLGFGEPRTTNCVNFNEELLDSEILYQADFIVPYCLNFAGLYQEQADDLFSELVNVIKEANIPGRFILNNDTILRKTEQNEAANWLEKLGVQSYEEPKSDFAGADYTLFPTLFEKNGLDYLWLDMDQAFCDDETCYFAIGDLAVMLDDTHISQWYSRTLGPLLAEKLQSLGL